MLYVLKFRKQQSYSSLYIESFISGPLVYADTRHVGNKAKTVNYLVGIVSFGSGCASEGNPGFYARVAAKEVLKWIRSFTGQSHYRGTKAHKNTKTTCMSTVLNKSIVRESPKLTKWLILTFLYCIVNVI